MMCEGKQTYPTFTLANKIAKRPRKTRYGQMQPYRCSDCGFIHVGHKPDIIKKIRGVKKPK